MSDSRVAVRTILITGATGAIGGALARDWAAPGITLHLHGRNKTALETLGQICRDKGASVELHSVDLTDEKALFPWIDHLDNTTPLDLAVAAAGVNTHPVDEYGESWENIKPLLDINLVAPIALCNRLSPRMQKRGHGQLVLMSSLAGYYGLPITSAYSASKAGIKAYGEGLRGWLAPHGVKVNVIMPGYVKSKMCDEMPGPKPFLWSPERASEYIRKRLAKNKARISFPFPLNFGTWWLAVLPASLSQWILGLMGYEDTH